MDPMMQQLQAEAQLRFGGQQPSSVGIGAPAANSSSPANPLANRGLLSSPQAPATGDPTMPSAQNPSAGAIDAVKQAKPDEAMFIIKALAGRLKQNPVQNPAQAGNV